MNRLHNFIVRISTWYVWLAFLVGFLVFKIVVVDRAIERMKTICGEMVKVPDMEIGYTGPQLENMLQYMNADCRVEYIRFAQIADVIFPLLYGFLLFFSIVILYYRAGVHVPQRWLYALPIFGIIADYGENFSIVRLLRMTNMDETSLAIASAFSMAKWFFLIASAVLIVLGAIRWLINRFRKTA